MGSGTVNDFVLGDMAIMTNFNADGIHAHTRIFADIGFDLSELAVLFGRATLKKKGTNTRHC